MTYVLYPVGLSMYFSRVPTGEFTSVDLRRQTGFIDDARKELYDLMEPIAHDAIIVFQGGEDISPELYGELNMHCHWINPHRDAWEKLCWDVSRELNIPFIGICRGHQLIAALNGGALYQDLHAQVGRDHHSPHGIVFNDDVAIPSGFYDLMRSNPLGRPDLVNSLHHQAVKRVPENAQVLARAIRDGTAEALLYKRGVTVQWHPEFLNHWQFLAHVRDNFLGEQRGNNRSDEDGSGDRVYELGASSYQEHAVARIHNA